MELRNNMTGVINFYLPKARNPRASDVPHRNTSHASRVAFGQGVWFLFTFLWQVRTKSSHGILSDL